MALVNFLTVQTTTMDEEPFELKLAFYPRKVVFNDGVWQVKASDGPWRSKNKYGLEMHLDGGEYPNTQKGALEAFMFSEDPFVGQETSEPLSMLLSAIVVDYLTGKLTWFPYHNETYKDDGGRLVRKSNGKLFYLPTTGSEFGHWEPRNEKFRDPNPDEEEIINVADYLKTVKGKLFFNASEFEQARDEYRQLMAEAEAE